MAKVQVFRGTTSYIARVFVQDTSKTDGSGLTGLVFNSGSLTAYYIRQGDATATAITLVTATVGTFTSSGFKEVDATNLPGLYEVGIPNAALSSGVSVLVMLKGATNMAPVLVEIELDSWNNQDAVRGGLTALPNANAGANGGLPTGNASGQVTVAGYASGEDPASLVLVTPAQKIATNASNQVVASSVQGNVTGSVGSVTGAVGSVTAAVVTDKDAAIDTINTNAAAIKTKTDQLVFTVANQVDANAKTVGDKTGYALTSGEHTLISGTDVPAGLVTGHLTTARADKLDDLDATISSRLATSGYMAPDNTDIATILTRTDVATSTRLAATADPTTALTEIAADTDTLITNVALQATASALSTAQTAITEIATDTDTIITNQGAQATSTALATAQTAITEIAVDTDSLLTGQALQATASALSTAQTGITEIAGDTDTLLTGLATALGNLSTINNNVVAVPAEVWTVLTATLTTAGSVGTYLLAMLNATITSRLASGAVTLDLTQAIPVSPRPSIGTVGEALAANRALAIGNESKPGSNAIALHASDDTTVLSTLTYAPDIETATSRTRS